MSLAVELRGTQGHMRNTVLLKKDQFLSLKLSEEFLE